jgi:hypothetical protein
VRKIEVMILVEEPHRRPRRREDNIKTDFKETGCENYWRCLKRTQNGVQYRALVLDMLTLASPSRIR